MTEQNYVKAQIFRSSNREFLCKLENSLKNELVEATSKGNLLKFSELVVGDFVLLKNEAKNWVIEERMARSSEIFRFIQREEKKKVIAANCDVLVLVFSANRPAFKCGLLDRYLVRSSQWGIPSIVVFNKMDEHNPKKLDLNFHKERLKGLVSDYFEVSAIKEISGEIDRLQAFLKDKTSLFLGASGVGKSTLITCLTGHKVELKSQEVGKVGKGKHTTTWSEIIDFENFKLVDSPGIRSFSLDDLLPEDLLQYFPDLFNKIHLCKFSNCQHDLSDKRCYFTQCENEYLKDRLNSYQNIYHELQASFSWDKKNRK